MSKSNTTESDLLKLMYNGTPIANLADNAASSPATNISVHLHTADPGETGSTTTNECSYGGYVPKDVARTTGGWTVTGGSVSPVAAITFAACTSGTATATHFSTSLAGSTVILHSGAITPSIGVSSGVTPQLTTATVITED